MPQRLAHIEPEPVELDERRNATPLQRARISERAGGRCEVLLDADGEPLPAGYLGTRCNNKLTPGWFAGHFPIQWHHGGKTELDNLRAECKSCAPKVGALENRAAKKTNRMGGGKGSQTAKRGNKSYQPIPGPSKEQRREAYRRKKLWAAQMRGEQ